MIDFIWLKELFFYALYANKFRDLKASNGLAHIFFINCATQASFVQKNGWWNISSYRYSSACLYALKCTNWLPLAFKPLNFRVLKWKRKTLSITFVLVQAKRNHTFMNCQVKSILTFFIFCHLTVWYFFLNVKSFLCHMGCLMQVKGDIRITYKTAAHQHNMIAAAAVDHFQSGMRERCTLSAPDEVWLMSGWWIISC